jgi:hypothetical protein
LPILKPAKPAGVGSSYRPISLLSPAIKILERLLLPSIATALKTAPSQHRFRSICLTSTALLPQVAKISEGFNCKKPADRTVMVVIDISKAFNMVDVTLLLRQILGIDLHPNLVRWLAIYLQGRSAA